MSTKLANVFEDTKKGSRTSGFTKIGKKPSVGHILVLLCLLSPSMAQAKIQTDGSLGSAQSLSGPDYVINEELGKRAGNNLFHSFSEFSIDGGQSATFTGAGEITNVISRVTGGNLSRIDGLLKSEIAGANLYLINPAGVLFGSNASLSISGSFHTSTADFIRMGADDSFFSQPLQGEILSTAAPEAFGFFGAPKGTITVRSSQLNLEKKADLSLVGGVITITDEARIRIPQGRINVVGVDSAGEVIINASGRRTTETFTKLNTVSIENRSELNVDGEGGGRVVIRAGRLLLEDAVLSAKTEKEENGDGINIVTDEFDFVRSRLDTTTNGTGKAGGIRIDAKTLLLDGRGEPESTGLFANSINLNPEQDAESSGAAGTIIIAVDKIGALGDVALETTADSSEKIGTIDLSTCELTLDGSYVQLKFNSGIGEMVPYINGNNITLDGSFHPDRNGKVLDGPRYEIKADMGQIVGKNLFLSFSEFSLYETSCATFCVPGIVSNIIMRVTGDNPTHIYGPLISNIQEVNFYLMNPNGLFFGPGASLDIKNSYDSISSDLFNSFNAGTADYLTLNDGGRFDISDPDRSLLSSGDLSAYGFIDNEIGEITAEGSYLFLNRKAISLIGGNIRLKDFSLQAPSGHVNLVSLQSAGEAFIANESSDIGVSDFSVFGDITLDDSSSALVTNVSADNESGRIFVRGNHLKLDNRSRFQARNIVEKKVDGGSIDILISGDLFIGKGSSMATTGQEPGPITIVAENVSIDGLGQQEQDFTGIRALQLERPSKSQYSLKMKVAQDLNIINGGEIALSNFSDEAALGAKIEAKNLTLGPAFDLSRDSEGRIEIDTGIYTISGSERDSSGTGNGGNLEIIVAEHLQILDGGIISTSTFNAGNAGNATLKAKNLTIDGRERNFANISSVAYSKANGGNIDITVTEHLNMVNGVGIGALSQNGNAGNLRISAGGNIYIADSELNISAGQDEFDPNELNNFQQPELLLESGDSIYIENSLLSTEAGTLGSNLGVGGNIYLQAPMDIWLENSRLLAQAGYGGGNVFIEPIRYIVISSDVIAQSDTQGGNYSVIVSTPNGWIQSTDSLINLSGEQSGSIRSNTYPFDLGTELSNLNIDLLNTEDWISQPCEFRMGVTNSSFIVNGWRSVSNNASYFLPSEPILLADYEPTQTEPIDEEFLRELIFFEVDEDCEYCP